MDAGRAKGGTRRMYIWLLVVTPMWMGGGIDPPPIQKPNGMIRLPVNTNEHGVNPGFK